MSENNVRTVLEGFRRFNEGEVEATADLWREDAVLTAPVGWPEKGPFHGREAIVQQFVRLAEVFTEQKSVGLEVIGSNEDWVVLSWTWETKGAGSGVLSNWSLSAAFRMVDEQIAAGHYRWSADEALEAAGLGAKD